MADVNRRAVQFVAEVASRRPDVDTVVNGAIGPRGDGYVVEDMMSAAEATNYHALQVEALASGGADMVSAITMTNVEEAIGIARAASRVGIPVVISFTVETDGRLPSGQELGAAIEQVDAETGGAPAYIMVNCAHPTHFHDVLAAGGEWTERIKGLRANASTLSHVELDEATELDRGDIADLADRYVHVRDVLGGAVRDRWVLRHRPRAHRRDGRQARLTGDPTPAGSPCAPDRGPSGVGAHPWTDVRPTCPKDRRRREVRRRTHPNPSASTAAPACSGGCCSPSSPAWR